MIYISFQVGSFQFLIDFFALSNTRFVYFGKDLLNLNPLTFEVMSLIFFFVAESFHIYINIILN